MAYTLVTATDFKTRFPVFEDEDDARISALLLEAGMQVDDTWVSQEDYTAGVMYLTAHLLVTERATLEEGADSGSGDGEISSESFGPLSVSYKASSGNVANDFVSEYSTTSYGKRWLRLVARNKPGIVAV